MTAAEPRLSRAAATVRIVGFGLLLVLAAVLITTVGPDVDDLRGAVDDLGVLAPVAYVLMYAALTVLLVPGVLLTTTAGLLFGLFTGAIVTLCGAVLGATASFVIARRVGRSSVERLLSGRAAEVDRWVADRGLVSVLTLRLVPLVPFSIANWAAGVTSIRMPDYVVGTALGIVPGALAYVAVGASLADPGSPLFIGAIIGLALLSVGGAVALRRRGTGRDGSQRDEAEPTPVP